MICCRTIAQYLAGMLPADVLKVTYSVSRLWLANRSLYSSAPSPRSTVLKAGLSAASSISFASRQKPGEYFSRSLSKVGWYQNQVS